MNQTNLLPGFLWILSSLPLLLLLFLLVFVKMKGTLASALSWAAASLIAFAVYGITARGFLTANGKGIGLAVFVLLIIWSSILLYNIVNASGAIKVIGAKISSVSADKTMQLLLLGWCFSALIQGMAGFGVPVAVTAPLIAGIGFSPIIATSAVLIGHAWAVTFGSMASSYFTIRLVSSVPDLQLIFWLGVLFIPAIILSGFCIAHLYGGRKGVKTWAPVILFVGALMGILKLGTAYLGAVQLATVIPAVGGMAALGIIAGRKSGGPVPVDSSKHSMSFFMSVLPYGILMALVLFFQIPPIKEAVGSIQYGLSFGEMETTRGFFVPAVSGYAAVRLFGHPAPFLFFSSLAAMVIYLKAGTLDRGKLNEAFAATKKQCVKPTITIFLLVMMALIMNDSGMTHSLAGGLAGISGAFFPLISPFIGVLGSFMTGSNTNSNILFGAFQQQIAIDIGVPAAILLAAQSVGGSLGSAIAPAKVVLGASTTGGTEHTGKILSITVKYCLFITAVIGVITLVFAVLLK